MLIRKRRGEGRKYNNLSAYDSSYSDEEQVTKGHKIKLTDEGKPQRVFGKVDPNNVAITMQGPGSVSVSSHLTDGSQTVIFDPRPVDPCPDKNCPQKSGRKRHKN